MFSACQPGCSFWYAVYRLPNAPFVLVRIVKKAYQLTALAKAGVATLTSIPRSVPINDVTNVGIDIP